MLQSHQTLWLNRGRLSWSGWKKKKKTVKPTPNFGFARTGVRISNDGGKTQTWNISLLLLWHGTVSKMHWHGRSHTLQLRQQDEISATVCCSTYNICRDYSLYGTSVVWGENDLISKSLSLASHNWITDTVNMQLLLLPLLPGCFNTPKEHSLLKSCQKITPWVYWLTLQIFPLFCSRHFTLCSLCLVIYCGARVFEAICGIWIIRKKRHNPEMLLALRLVPSRK